MKKLFKQYMMAIVAVMLVVGFSAFKVVETRSIPMESTLKQSDDPILYTWRFQSNDPNDLTQPSEYQKKDDDDPECEGDDIVCEIEAPEDENGHPDLDAKVDPEDPDPNSPTYGDLINQAMQTPKSTNEVVLSFRN